MSTQRRSKTANAPLAPATHPPSNDARQHQRKAPKPRRFQGQPHRWAGSIRESQTVLDSRVPARLRFGLLNWGIRSIAWPLVSSANKGDSLSVGQSIYKCGFLEFKKPEAQASGNPRNEHAKAFEKGQRTAGPGQSPPVNRRSTAQTKGPTSNGDFKGNHTAGQGQFARAKRGSTPGFPLACASGF